MNSVVLVGRLANDPQKRDPVVTFNLAVDRQVREGEEKKADFPRITAFGKQGETCAKYLKTGRLIALRGHIQTGSYLKNGITVYTTDIIMDSFEFLDHTESKPKHSYNGAANRIEETQMEVPNNFEAVEEDIPF